MGKYALHQAPLHHQAWPHGGAYSQLNTCACALCSLPLSRIGARALCSLSLGNARLDPSLSHAARALSHWGTCTVLSLSRIVSVVFPFSRMQLCSLSLSHAARWEGGGVGRRNSKRSLGAQEQQEEAWGAAAGGGMCSKKSKRRHGVH
jgi:hypothetical protein